VQLLAYPAVPRRGREDVWQSQSVGTSSPISTHELFSLPNSFSRSGLERQAGEMKSFYLQKAGGLCIFMYSILKIEEKKIMLSFLSPILFLNPYNDSSIGCGLPRYAGA
jgi:hypothetical protein